MHLERSPSRTGPDAPDAQQADVPRSASPLQRHELEHGCSWASQLLNIERCNDRLNPPCKRKHKHRLARRYQHANAASMLPDSRLSDWCSESNSPSVMSSAWNRMMRNAG